MTNTPFDKWGVECNKGWNHLVTPLLILCEEEGVEVIQVKEKFGGLRFYTYNSNELLQEMIDTAEILSYKTCELCGEPGITRKGGWVKTLCDSCWEAKNDQG